LTLPPPPPPIPQDTEPLDLDTGGGFGEIDFGILGMPKAKADGEGLQREEYGIRLQARSDGAVEGTVLPHHTISFSDIIRRPSCPSVRSSLPGLRIFATFQAFMARDIPRMDWNSPAGMAGVQPYVALSCGSKTAKTRRKASRDPQWRQEIGISLMLPPGAQGAPPVRFQLYDHNFTASDRPIAAFRVPFRVRAAWVGCVCLARGWMMPSACVRAAMPRVTCPHHATLSPFFDLL
jgi:hypothetical protein